MSWEKTESPNVFVLAVQCSIAFCICQCGVEERAFFKDKAFKTAAEIEAERTRDALPQPGGDFDRVIPEDPYGTADQGKKGGMDDLKDQDDLGEFDDLDESIDPMTLVLHSQFLSTIDQSSAFRLINNQSPRRNLSLAESNVKDRLSKGSAEDGVVIEQTFGDGIARSEGRQQIINAVGDIEVDTSRGYASASGRQRYVRVSGDPACPAAAVCIDRLEFEPDIGEDLLICIYDPASGAPTVFPYAVAPGMSVDDYQKSMGSFGPYLLKRYRDLSVDCAANAPGFDASEVVLVEVEERQIDVNMERRYLQHQDAFDYQQALVMRTIRQQDDNRAPYVDEIMKLQWESVFIFDHTKNVLAKMIKRSRSSVDLPFLAGLFMSMNGLMVDIHFEFCVNEMQQGSGYCQSR